MDGYNYNGCTNAGLVAVYNTKRYRTWNDLVYKWFQKRLNNRKYRKRPLEIKIIVVSKALNLSYSKVRYSIDNLVKSKIITKYTVKIGGNPPHKISRYVWSESDIKNELSTGSKKIN